MLTSAQRDQYDAEGYTVVPDVLTRTELARARRLVAEFVERSRQVPASDGEFDLGEGHSPTAPRVRRWKDPVANDSFFAGIMRSPRVLDAVSALVGDDVRFHSSKLNLKDARDGEAVQWHQDFAFFPHTNDDLVACGIALDDADEANGCLVVIPGSHRGPVLDHHQDGRFVGGVPSDHPVVQAGPLCSVSVPAGGMSLHHVRLLHASRPNPSDRARRMLFLQYAAADAFPITYAPAVDFPPLTVFDRLVVRGRQTGRARMANVSVDLPRFGGGYGSIYDVQANLANPAFADELD